MFGPRVCKMEMRTIQWTDGAQKEQVGGVHRGDADQEIDQQEKKRSVQVKRAVWDLWLLLEAADSIPRTLDACWQDEG